MILEKFILFLKGHQRFHESRLTLRSLVKVLWVLEYHPHKASGRMPCGLGFLGERALMELGGLDDLLDPLAIVVECVHLGVMNDRAVHSTL